MSDPETDSRLEIPRLVWRLEQAIDQLMDATLEPLGLTIALQGTLRAIAQQPGVSAADLARTLQISAQSVAHAIARLEQLGFIERRPHPIHGRILQIFPTDAGLETVEQGDALVYERSNELLAVLPEADQRQLRSWILLLRRRAQELSHSAGFDE